MSILAWLILGLIAGFIAIPDLSNLSRIARRGLALRSRLG